MDFANPERIWLLALCLALAGWAMRGRGIRRGGWRALGWNGRPFRDGAWLTIGTCVFLSFALARPRSLGPGDAAGGLGRDVVLAVDVSRSMAVEDAVPNRLGAAVETANGLLQALAANPANRAAVVAFAGKGVVRCPLTENLGAVAAALDRLEPGCVEPGGTDLASAVEAALELFPPNQPSGGRAIILFSDGEDHENRWPSLARRLDESGVSIHAVAIGDDQTGRPVPFDSPDAHLVYHGRPVESRRVDQALLQLVHETGGTFVPLGLSTVDLGSLYVSRIEPTLRRAARAQAIERVDGFPILLFCALTLATAIGWPAGWGWPRWRPGRAPAATEREPGKKTARAVALAVAASALALSAGAGDARRAGGQGVARAIDQGRAQYAAGRYDLALEQFQLAAQLAPNHAIPRFDMASTLYQMGRLEDAMALYTAARSTADPRLRVKIDFALGNTALSLGDPTKAVEYYDACLASTERGRELDQVRRDAAENRRYAVDQIQSPAAPETPDAEQAGQERQPREDPSQKEQRETEIQAKTKKSQGSRSGGSRPRSSAGHDRTGGAGGSNPGDSSPPDRSPADRLNDALDKIQDALDDRLDDETSPPRPKGDRKDW